jgi:hypothetical protein
MGRKLQIVLVALLLAGCELKFHASSEPNECELAAATVIGTTPNEFPSQCMNGALNATVQFEDGTVQTLCLTADKGTAIRVCK